MLLVDRNCTSLRWFLTLQRLVSEYLRLVVGTPSVISTSLLRLPPKKEQWQVVDSYSNQMESSGSRLLDLSCRVATGPIFIGLVGMRLCQIAFSIQFVTSPKQTLSLASLCAPWKYAISLRGWGAHQNRHFECSQLTVLSSYEVRNRMGTSILSTTFYSYSSSVLNCPFYQMLLLRRRYPSLTRNWGTSDWELPISTASSENDLKQESRITPIISLWMSGCSFSMRCSQYLRAAAEPIDLPQSTNFLVLNFYFKVATTAAISYFSLAPKEMESPSELPQPLKSKQQKESPIRSTVSTYVEPRSRAAYFIAWSHSYYAGRGHRYPGIWGRSICRSCRTCVSSDGCGW